MDQRSSLSLSLNLVINYEREIIINICLPAVRPSMRTSSGRIWSWIGVHRLFFQAGNQRQTPSCEVGRIYLTLQDALLLTRNQTVLTRTLCNTDKTELMRQQQPPGLSPDRELASEREWP